MKTLKLSAILLIILFCTQNSKAQNQTIVSENAVFNVFPNPNDGEETYVNLQGFKANDLLVVVYDMFGREIYSKVEIREQDGFLFTLSTDGKKLPTGVYIITASSNDKVFQQKLIVK